MKIWSFEEEAARLAARFQGVSQAAFARTHRVPGGPSMVSQHIKGRRPISMEAAITYAIGFGVPLEEISPRLAHEAARAGTALGVGAAVGAISPPQLGGEAHTMTLDRFTVHLHTAEEVMSGAAQEVFLYEVTDDAMSPQVERGDTALFSRTRPPKFGKPVLVQVGNELHVRNYEQGRVPGQWLARPVKAGYAAFDSLVDSMTLVAVSRGVVEPND